MNKEKQRIKIAEACGWTFRKSDGARIPPNKPELQNGLYYAETMPLYLEDFNAIAEVKKILTAEQRRKYGEILVQIVKPHHPLCPIILYAKNPISGEQIFNITNATVEQESECLLRTLGLWEDEA